jgi:hypothetical protein
MHLIYGYESGKMVLGFRSILGSPTLRAVHITGLFVDPWVAHFKTLV